MDPPGVLARRSKSRIQTLIDPLDGLAFCGNGRASGRRRSPGPHARQTIPVRPVQPVTHQGGAPSLPLQVGVDADDEQPLTHRSPPAAVRRIDEANVPPAAWERPPGGGWS